MYSSGAGVQQFKGAFRSYCCPFRYVVYTHRERNIGLEVNPFFFLQSVPTYLVILKYNIHHPLQ